MKTAKTKMSVLTLTLLAVVALAGCSACPDGELQIVNGSAALAPGDHVSLAFHWGEERLFGPEDCGGLWYVDGILGGDETVGTITECGTYTAPDIAPPNGTVLIEALEHDESACSECCAAASTELVVGG